MMSDVRICFFGDSFVNGTLDDSYLGWPGRVSARLRASGMGLTTYNLGVRRDTSGDVRARWRSEAARRLPDQVDGRLVFSFGVNDCVEVAGVRRVSLADTLSNAEQIFAEAAAWKPTLVIGPPATATEDQGSINERIHAVSEGLLAVCAALCVPYVGLFDRLIDQPDWRRETAAEDGVHPSGAGYERIAEIILSSPGWIGWVGSSSITGS